MAGVDLPTLGALLGHTTIQMTMRYVHPAEEHKREAAVKIENYKAASAIRLVRGVRGSLQFPLQCNENNEQGEPQDVENIGRGARIRTGGLLRPRQDSLAPQVPLVSTMRYENSRRYFVACMCVDVRRCGCLIVGSLQKSLQFLPARCRKGVMKPTVRTLPIAQLVLDDKNANKGTKRGRELLEQSLEKYGAGRSVLVDRHNRVIAGNKTVEAARAAGLASITVIETDGTSLVAFSAATWISRGIRRRGN